MLKDIVTGYES